MPEKRQTTNLGLDGGGHNVCGLFLLGTARVLLRGLLDAVESAVPADGVRPHQLLHSVRSSDQDARANDNLLLCNRV